MTEANVTTDCPGCAAERAQSRAMAERLSAALPKHDVQLAARFALLERAATDDHPATVRLHVKRLGEMLRERGLV